MKCVFQLRPMFFLQSIYIFFSSNQIIIFIENICLKNIFSRLERNPDNRKSYYQKTRIMERGRRKMTEKIVRID